ncbi:MAG: lipopolysaccharide biosynthesis protein, partial [Acidiferrobacterales bacterium]
MVANRISLKSRTLSKWFSDESLTRKAYLNAIASALDYGTRLAVGFVINPLLVTGLGSYGYGVWQVLGRLVGSINPVGGRSTQALKWTIANQQASTDYEEKRRQVGSAVAVWLLFLPLLVSLGAVLAWFAPIWLNAPAELSQSVRFAAAILVVSLIIVSIADVPRSVLTGENLGYKRMGLSALLVAVGGALTALALYLNAGLVGVATASLAATILTGVLFLKVARVHVPWFGIAKPLRGAVRSFLRLSGWFLVWGLVMRLMRASDVVILGILESAELVTIYSLTKYVPETLISLVAIVVFGITPGLGGIIGSRNLQKAIRVRKEIMSFTWLLVTVLGATILLWNESFVRLWVGQEYYAGPIPTLLMIGMVTQFVLIRNDASIIDLTLDLRRKVLIGLLSATLSIVAAGVLVGPLKMGIMGLCVGFIAGRSILTLSYPWLVGRYLGVSLSSQLT